MRHIHQPEMLPPHSGKRASVVFLRLILPAEGCGVLNRGLEHKQQEDTYLYDTHTPMNLLQKGAIAILSTAAAFRKKVVKLAKPLLLCLHKTEYGKLGVPAVLQEPIWLQLLERPQVVE